VNTLIALDAGVIENEEELVAWPGQTDTVKYGYRPDIYKDMNMKEAFQLSAGWVYVELAKRIGKEKYAGYLKQIGYGNADASIDDPDFWNFGEFGISPVNQIEILIKVYKEMLPFSKAHLKMLKEIMITEKGDDYVIRAKTGWTRDKGINTGWWVGYVEKAGNVYFFATRLVKDRSLGTGNFGPCRKEITRQILKELSIL
jgi:beta-lactamase class D